MTDWRAVRFYEFHLSAELGLQQQQKILTFWRASLSFSGTFEIVKTEMLQRSKDKLVLISARWMKNARLTLQIRSN